MVQSPYQDSSLLLDLACVLDIPPYRLDLSGSFSQHGGDSIAALKLVAASRLRGQRLRAGNILKSESLYEILSSATGPAQSIALEQEVQGNKPLKSIRPLAALENFPSHRESHHQCRSPVTHTQKTFLASNETNRLQCSTLHFIETWPTKHICEVKSAWMDALASEPIFATKFIEENGAILLQGCSFSPPVWEEHDVTSDEGRAIAVESALQPLQNGERSRFTVVSLSSTSPFQSTVIWAVDHAVIDWISLRIIHNKMLARLKGDSITYGPCFIEFARAFDDFQTRQSSQGTQFWKDQKKRYGECETLFQLRTMDQIAASERTGEVGFEFVSERLTSVAASWKVPVSILYYAAWASVCSMLSDSDHVSFGAVLSGRTSPAFCVEDMVGAVMQTLPIILRMDEFDSLRSLAVHLVDRIKELSEHTWTLPKHGYSMKYESALDIIPMTHEHVQTTIKPTGPASFYFRSDIPWSISVIEDSYVRIVYHAHKYSEAAARTVSDLFETTLARIADSHSACTDPELATLPGPMESMLRNYGRCHLRQMRPNRPSVDLVTLFQRTAATQPDRLAIEKGNDVLTFAQLDERSDRIAAHIFMYIEPGEVVGVLADRSLNWLVAAYAVLKAQGVYYPISPTLSQKMRDEQFLAAKAQVFITGQRDDLDQQPASCTLPMAIQDLLSITPISRKRRLPTPRSTAAAYLCFTSGTSGLPKGVLCRHESLVAFQKSFDVRLRARPGWRIAQTMSPSFDGSIHEIFSTLSYGATLVLPDDGDPLKHLSKVDCAILTPTVANAISPSELERLSVLYLVGEAVPQDVCDKWAQTKTVFNMYGPTEATGGATIKQLRPGMPVTIGKPNPSSRVYVLDRNGDLTPPGVVGNIYIAGIQVSSGYINRDDETKKNFSRDCICPETGDSMYNTADRGYWDDHGEVRILGRRDRQIKFKGYRIDLDDIEARIQGMLRGCKSVAVFVKGESLRAVMCPETLDMDFVQSTLSTQLPSYMRPRLFHLVHSMPLTQAGKTDYSALSDSITVEYEPAPFDMGRTACEIRLADIWRQALGLATAEHIQPSTRVRDLGGDSMSAMEIRSVIAREIRVDLPLRHILEFDSLRQMAQIIDAASMIESENPTQQPQSLKERERCEDVSPMEMEWWKRYEQGGQTQAFNVSLSCNLEACIDLQKLQTAWNEVLARHSIWTSRFRYHEGDIRRVTSEIPPRASMSLQIDVHSEVNTPFVLADNDLIRVNLCPGKMLVVASHIICDLTSLRKTLDEVKHVYQGKSLREVAPTWQSSWNPVSHEMCERWEQWLFNGNARSASTHDPMAPITNGTSLVFEVQNGLLKKIRGFTHRMGITVHQFLLAIAAMASTTNVDPAIDVVLGAPHMNRHTEQEKRAMGLYLQPLPIRVRWPAHAEDNEMTLSDYSTKDSVQYMHSYLQSVRKSSEFALGNAMPWTALRDYCVQQGRLHNEDELFDTMVTFHERGQWVDELLPGMTPIMTWSGGSKFHCLCEWIATGSGAVDASLILRLEYSHRWFSESQARAFVSKMATIAACLIDDKDCETIRVALEGDPSAYVREIDRCEVVLSEAHQAPLGS